MNFWFLTLGFFVDICYCQNLVCDKQNVYDIYNGDVDVKIKVMVGYSNGNLQEGTFQISRRTVVIIHGFVHFIVNDFRWMNDMAREFLSREPMNVILVNWINEHSLDIRYKRAALSTEMVTVMLCKFLRDLLGERSYSDFHFIGHSLGAHIAGQTARRLQRFGVGVERVTGLDPAYPCFETSSASLRLRSSDANFVDVIHTDSQYLDNAGHYGIYDRLGDQDFYPDGGNNQKKCRRQKRSLKSFFRPLLRSVKKPLKPLIEKSVGVPVNHYVKKALITGNVGCSHHAAVEYFMESLVGKKRWGSPVSWPLKVDSDMERKNLFCDKWTCAEMGVNAASYKNLKGAFYVNTESS